MYDINTNLELLTSEPDDHPRQPGLATVSGSVGAWAPAGASAQDRGLHGLAAAAAGRAPAAQAYWRNSYTGESYYEPGHSFEDYAPAYELGWSSRAQAGDDRDFDAAEQDMQRAWESHRAASRLTWEQARAAMRAAWHRVDVDLGDATPQ